MPTRGKSMAMQIRRYNAKHIAQYSRSSATLDAAGCRYGASILPVLPRRMPWSLILAKKMSCGVVKLLFQS